ncbi:YraN family protein [Cupriavidus sp. 2TAF22]|uniref:YraN family protein n=1 Tax=unclassified Cupriavidus TaxID=2640874 RepID=UPI003F8F3D1C
MNPSFKSTTQAQGARAEARALAHLERHGLALVVRNYRCKGGEIDLIMREADGTLVFVEVRERASRTFGGAAASVTPAKQRRILLAAAHFLAAQPAAGGEPGCRLDVVALEPGRLEWIRGAFGADGG